VLHAAARPLDGTRMLIHWIQSVLSSITSIGSTAENLRKP
jgi:hypothetical protein